VRCSREVEENEPLVPNRWRRYVKIDKKIKEERMVYRWGRAFVCFLSRNDREGNTESPPALPSSTETKWSLQQVRTLSWKGRIRAIGPLTSRLKSTAAVHGNELQPPEEEGGDRIAQEKRNFSRQGNRQTRKSILTAKKRENNEGCPFSYFLTNNFL
jgi:hypothetical protein